MKIALYPFRSRYLLVLALLLWQIPFWVGHEPWNDEAYTTSLIDNVLNTGDRVVPLAGGLPFMEKPPLYYITAAASARMFSDVLPLHDAARLANIAWMLITLAGLALSALAVSNRQGALLALLLLLGCLGIWEVYHRLITDVALLSGYTLGITGLILAWQRPLLAGILLGTGAGMAFMAKGLLGPGLLGLIGLVLPLCFPQYRQRQYWLAILYAIVAALPWVTVWPLALYNRSPTLFHDWLWLNNIGRFLGDSSLGPSEKFAFYFYSVLWQAWPAIVLAGGEVYNRYRKCREHGSEYLYSTLVLAGLATAVILLLGIGKVYALPLGLWLILLAHRSARENFQPMLVLYIAFAVPLMVLSLASTSTDIYGIVLLPALVLLACNALPTLPRRLASVLGRINVGLIGLMLATVLVSALLLNAGFDNPVRDYFLGRLPDYVPQLTLLQWCLGGLIIGAWLVVLRITPLSRLKIAWRWSGGIIAVGLLFDLLWRPYIAYSLDYTPMIRDLQAHLPSQYNCIAAIDLGESPRGMIQYRGGIVVQDYALVGEKATACELELLREDQLEQASTERWPLLWRGSRPGDRKIYSLYRIPDKASVKPQPAPLYGAGRDSRSAQNRQNNNRRSMPGGA